MAGGAFGQLLQELLRVVRCDLQQRTAGWDGIVRPERCGVPVGTGNGSNVEFRCAAIRFAAIGAEQVVPVG